MIRGKKKSEQILSGSLLPEHPAASRLVSPPGKWQKNQATLFRIACSLFPVKDNKWLMEI
jgi:hypothetical protein